MQFSNATQFNISFTVFRRIVNACAGILRDHGPEYSGFVLGETSASGPLQVLRAALVMPPPFDDLPPAVRRSLACLAEKAVLTMEQLERSAEALQTEVVSLQHEVDALSGLQDELARSTAEVRSLRIEAEASRHREAALAAEFDALRQEVQLVRDREADVSALIARQRADAGASRRREAALAAEVRALRQDVQLARDREVEAATLVAQQQVQLEEAALAAAEQEAALLQSAKVVKSQATELSRRPSVDILLLRRCLAEAAEGRLSRYARRDARKLLEQTST